MNRTLLYERLPIPLQEIACSAAGWKRSRDRFNPHFHRTLAAWTTSIDWPVEKLHALQWERLQHLVDVARQHVPHYRSLDIAPPTDTADPAEGISKLLATLPVLKKSTYRDSPEAFVADNVAPSQLIRGKTSGTTGTALPLWYTTQTLAEEYATVWRMRRLRGVKLRDPHFTFGGQLIVPLMQKRPPFWRRDSWGRQALFSLYHMKPTNLDSYIDGIHSLPARYVQGYPSALYYVGRAMLDAGRPLPPSKLTAVFPSSESLLAFHRDVIEQAFGAPIFDRYGTSEFAVSMTGCVEGNLHVDMEFGIVEVEVEEETDQYVRGPLLVTGLANTTTPFIRYRIGDVGTRAKHPCPCGRPGDVFLDVDGRLEDYVVTPDGRWVGRLDHIFKDQLDIIEAQITQADAASIEVYVVPSEKFDEDSRAALLREIRVRLGNEIRVRISLVDEIARERNGKFRAVKSVVGRMPR